jgi:hypothetical protein
LTVLKLAIILYGWEIGNARFSPLRDIFVPNFATDELGVNSICVVAASHLRKLNVTVDEGEYMRYFVKVSSGLRVRMSQAATPPTDRTLAAVVALIAEYAQVWSDVSYGHSDNNLLTSLCCGSSQLLQDNYDSTLTFEGFVLLLDSEVDGEPWRLLRYPGIYICENRST